jgi:hypothetical protein
MKKYLLLLACLFFTSLAFAQKPEVEVRGLLNLSASEADTQSVFIGLRAGINDDGTNNGNTFLGAFAGQYNNSGWGNTFLGKLSGRNNQFGDKNTLVGSGAGLYNVGGNDNTFIGYLSGYLNTYGSGNVFLGSSAGRSNTTGVSNSFLGKDAGYSNTTGLGNVFLGSNSGRTNSSGNHNTFLGYFAGYSNMEGNDNIFIGHSAGNKNALGSSNIAIGHQALMRNETQSGLIAIGDSALYHNGEGAQNETAGTKNTAVGHKAGFSTTLGNQNTLVGYNAGFSSDLGNNNTFMGFDAGKLNSTGYGNTFIGSLAGRHNQTGHYNTLVGILSSLAEDDLKNATAIGYAARVGCNDCLVLGGTGINAVKVGIGTEVPTSSLHIVGDDHVGLHIESSGIGYTDLRLTTPTSNYSWSSDFDEDKFLLFNQNTGTSLMTIRPTGRVSIGTSDPASGLDVNGHLLITQVDTDNSEESVMVVQSDGTLAKREASTINAGNGIVSGAMNGTMLELTLENGSVIQIQMQQSVQARLDNGEHPWDLYKSGVPMTNIYGKTWGGGLIFYIGEVSGTVLIAAPQDQSYLGGLLIEAGCMTGGDWPLPNITDPLDESLESTGITDGLSNTVAIVAAACSDNNDAPVVCYNLDLNGYKDWYLPSTIELLKMYENLFSYGCPETIDPPCSSSIGNFIATQYWSSTKINSLAAGAWTLDFFDGEFKVNFRSSLKRVRAIRAVTQ